MTATSTHRSLSWIDDELRTLDALTLRRHLSTRESGSNPACIEVGGRELINFGSNDYLGLASEALNKSVTRTVRERGWGSGASPLITGRATEHALLEEELAAFENVEAALVFPTGYAANVGTITSLATKSDIIFSDEKNHASIIDGCRLSGARVRIYPHLNYEHLEKLIEQAGDFRRRLIVTDSLFSMDGHVAPLDHLVRIADSHSAMLVVDEAHATGVFGEHGRGICEHLGVEEQVAVRVGTLSKALGSHGGFVAGSRSLIDWLTNRARTYFFSTAAPEAVAAAGRAALKFVQDEPLRRQTLLRRAKSLTSRLRADGWHVGDTASQIIPIILGQPESVMQMTTQLIDDGFLVPGIRPPSVPEGESLLRISLSYAHTDQMIDSLADTLLTYRR